MPGNTSLIFKTAGGALVAAALALSANSGAFAADISLSALGVVSTNTTQSDVEQEFYNNLAGETGLDIVATYRNLDVAGLKEQDVLRMVGSGAFDVVDAVVGPAARDDMFLEGIDLVGVSPTLDDLHVAVDAYRDVFDKRISDRFNAKVVTIWPYGPQYMYCNDTVKSLSDIEGKKVRTYTASMSDLVSALGGIPVSMSFPEVYLGLQRGVVDCAITSPTSGNTGKWPEVTSNLLPVSINWAMNVHLMNQNTWNKLTPDQQGKLSTAFSGMEKKLWDGAGAVSDQAVACNVGSDDCTGFTKYDMNLVDVTDADREKLNGAVSSTILPKWGKSCSSVYSECVDVWNDTIGKARGYTITLN